MLKSYPLNIFKVQSESSKLAIWDKVSFSLRIVPLIIHMNHFGYLLTIVQINIFEEPQNVFSQPKSQTPNYRATPPPRIFNYRMPLSWVLSTWRLSAPFECDNESVLRLRLHRIGYVYTESDTFTQNRIRSDPFGIGSTMVQIHSVYMEPVRN